MDELWGRQGTWRFDGKSVLMRYQAGWRTDRLLKRLGQCDVPVSAIASVDFRPGAGKRKGWVLGLELVECADPYRAVGGTLARGAQPFVLTGPAKSELVAEYWADQIRFAVGGEGGRRLGVVAGGHGDGVSVGRRGRGGGRRGP